MVVPLGSEDFSVGLPKTASALTRESPTLIVSISSLRSPVCGWILSLEEGTFLGVEQATTKRMPSMDANCFMVLFYKRDSDLARGKSLRSNSMY